MLETQVSIPRKSTLRRMKKSLLFITREFTDGGAAYLTLRHLRVLTSRYTLTLLVTGPISHELRSQLPSGVRLVTVWVPQDVMRHGLQACLEALANLPPVGLDDVHAAVIGCSLFPDVSACACFGLSKAPRKFLILLDEGPLIPGLPPFILAAIRSAMAQADHLLPVSRDLLTRLEHRFPVLGELPFTVIPPPIDATPEARPSPFASTPDGLPRLVTAARLVPDKGIHESLLAHRALRDAGLDFHWHIVGEGPERPALEQTVTELGMRDRFHLEGFRADARAFMRHADLCVLFSRSEGCPTVIREALAEGTPVLATAVNGARELIVEGETGCVIGHGEGEKIAALDRLLRTNTLRDALRATLRSRSPPPADAETRTFERLLDKEAPPRPEPRVSVLIPAFNHARVIAIAVRSALMQDYRALEVVVLDDASSDDTAGAVREAALDARLRYCRRSSRLGRVGNYRQGLEQDARGAFVLMLDGDDYLTDPGFISTAMAALAAHEPTPVFVQAGHRVLYRPAASNADWTLPHVDILPEIDTPQRLMSGAEYLHFVYATGFFTHLGSLYARQSALEAGFYRRDISSSDMDSLLRLALRGEVLVLNTVAGCWVQHGGNASQNLPLKNVLENAALFREIAHSGAAVGLVDLQVIEPALTRYEARTLAHLFQSAVGKSARGLGDLPRMLRIVLRVNPGVLGDAHLRRVGRRVARSLARLTWERWRRRLLQFVRRTARDGAPP